jgi:hypothetical protein
MLWGHRKTATDGLMFERALKLQNCFTNHCSSLSPYTKLPGVTVSLTATLPACSEILVERRRRAHGCVLLQR